MDLYTTPPKESNLLYKAVDLINIPNLLTFKWGLFKISKIIIIFFFFFNRFSMWFQT